MPQQIPVYTSCCDVHGISLPIYFLSRLDRSFWLHTVTSTQQNNLDQTISTAVSGTRLLYSHYSNTKGVFFGAARTDYWTNDAETLFRQSILWLITDETAPVISNLTVKNITNQSAIISWKTDDLSNYTIKYGTSLSLGNTISSSSFGNDFNVLLSGLIDNTTYYYNLTACNKFNYCTSTTTNNFKTLKTPDMSAPVLSGLNVNITNQSARITFNTDDNSNVSFRWGNTTTLGNLITNSSYSTSHIIDLNNLKEKTTYYYNITLCNSDGYCSTNGIYNFTTFDWTSPGMPVGLKAYVNNNDRSIILNWTAPSGEAVYRYNIYISNSPELSSFDFNNPDTNVSGTSYIDSDAGSYRQLFYVVRTQDESGNEEKNNLIVGKFDLALKIGENLISIPLQPFDSSIDKVMHEDNSYKPVTEIKREENNIWQSSSFNGLSWSGAITNIAMDKGYFFKSNTNTDFTIVGIVNSSSRNVNLVNGMNLVGWSSFDTVKLWNAIDENGIIEVSRRADDGHYQIATYYSQNSPNYWYSNEGFDELGPGKGYWFKTNSNVVWSYNP
jgi:hypothetical protein